MLNLGVESNFLVQFIERKLGGGPGEFYVVVKYFPFFLL